MGQNNIILGRICRCESLNFRSKKTYDPKNIIGILGKDDVFEILGGLSDNWVRIRFDGVIGYVVSDYITTDMEDTK